MGIISYFIPYLFTFASLIAAQRQPAAPDVIRPPGGRVVATVLAATGFTTVAIAIVLACIPSATEPNKPLAVLKVVGSSVLLLAVGQWIYTRGAREARAR